jgi:hypothetical protein
MNDLKNLRPRKELLLLVCAAALQMSPARAADEAPPAAAHPMVGTWSWTLFGGKCMETFQYRANSTMLSTSGEAVTEWNYTVTPQTTEKGFYRVAETSIRQNGKKDCSGDMVDETGTQNVKFIQLSPAKDRLIVCKAESLDACFGPLGRIQ